MAVQQARVQVVVARWKMVERRRISVVIPVLNEAEGIAAMLSQLQPLRQRGHEVVVVDGGSSDDTSRIAGDLADIVLHSSPGRARQMNLGVQSASGDVLWFLHADTLLPQDAEQDILKALAGDSSPCWGCFNVSISGNHWLLRLVALMMSLRSRVTGIATGDQGIFMSRSVFEKIGGFPDQPLMEDIELSKILKRYSLPMCLQTRITTSGRRWEQQGVIRTIILMWWLRLAYFFGVKPEQLAIRYNKGRL